MEGKLEKTVCKITKREEINPKHKRFPRAPKKSSEKKRQKELDISLVTEQEV